MSKRIITNDSTSVIDPASTITHFRVYAAGSIGSERMFAVIIANDGKFDGL